MEKETNEEIKKEDIKAKNRCNVADLGNLKERHVAMLAINVVFFDFQIK
jgi:hypothetical protein